MEWEKEEEIGTSRWYMLQKEEKSYGCEYQREGNAAMWGRES